MSKELYQEQILDHYHHPHNFGELKNPDERVEGANLSCGDEIVVTVNYDDDTVNEIGFSGNSCAICTAAASMLTDELIGKSVSEISDLKTKDILQLIGIELSPIRLKCALLPLETVKCLKRVGAHLQRPALVQN
ncbi:MAG: iron-sulfur cluster assembly scaffold protein [bacterium]|nr:iron-sulfur cluster assembly scaffold protein [bacterium]